MSYKIIEKDVVKGQGFNIEYNNIIYKPYNTTTQGGWFLGGDRELVITEHDKHTFTGVYLTKADFIKILVRRKE